jgi:hypothetical protein
MKPEKTKWMEDTFNSIEAIQRASAPANFYSNLMTRVKMKSSSSIRISVRLVSGVAAALALLVGMNIFSWVSYCRAVDSSTSLQMIATEYGLNTDTYTY